jgi:putative addiction module component (TIGR02574 family)
MTDAAAKLLADALCLPEEERLELADRIMESLGPDDDGMTEAEWEEEIRRRVEEVRTGQAQLISWEEAMRMITEDADEPSES